MCAWLAVAYYKFPYNFHTELFLYFTSLTIHWLQALSCSMREFLSTDIPRETAAFSSYLSHCSPYSYWWFTYFIILIRTINCLDRLSFFYWTISFNIKPVIYTSVGSHSCWCYFLPGVKFNLPLWISRSIDTLTEGYTAT